VRRAGEPLRDRVEENYRQSNRREQESQAIDRRGGQKKSGGTQNEQDDSRSF